MTASYSNEFYNKIRHVLRLLPMIVWLTSLHRCGTAFTVVSTSTAASLASFPLLSAIGGTITFPCGPRCVFDAQYYDGQVCTICHRETYEISSWDTLSCFHKGIAFEDALERYRRKQNTTTTTTTTTNNTDDPSENSPALFPSSSITIENLQQQSILWLSLAAAEAEAAAADKLSTEGAAAASVLASPSLIAIDTDTTAEVDNNSTKKLDTSVVASCINSNTSNTTTVPALLPPQSSLLLSDSSTGSGTADAGGRCTTAVVSSSAWPVRPPRTPPPTTPCTRICRYKTQCYAGRVCIGCFRETHDIAHWTMFSATEKYVALVDAADRCREFNKNPQHHPEHHYGYKNHNNTSNNVYEGSITEAELRQQATLWGLL